MHARWMIHVVLIATALCAAEPVMGRTLNVLRNPGFEIADGALTNAADWYQAGSVARTDWAHIGGSSYGMVWKAWDGWWGYFLQDVYTNLVPGDVLTFSIWAQAGADYTSSSGEAYMKLECWTNAADYSYSVAYNGVYRMLTNHPDQAVKLSLTVTNTAFGIGLVKPLVGGGGWTGQGAVRFDDAELVINAQAPPVLDELDIAYQDGTVLQWDSLDTWAYRITSATAPDKPYTNIVIDALRDTPPVNVRTLRLENARSAIFRIEGRPWNGICNEDFEVVDPEDPWGADGWTRTEGASRRDWYGYSGVHAMVWEGWTTNGQGCFSQCYATNLAVGDAVEFSIYGYVENDFVSTTAQACIELTLWREGTAAAVVEQRDIYAGLDARREEWVLFTLGCTNYVPGVTGVSVQVRSAGWRPAGEHASVYWDHARLLVARALDAPSPAFRLAGRDAQQDLNCWVTWDAEMLELVIGNAGSLLDPFHQYYLYLCARTADAVSGFESPPMTNGMSGPPAFSWNLMSANPMPGDAGNYSPCAVRILDESQFLDGQDAAASMSMADIGADLQVPGAYLDLLAVLYDDTEKEVAAVFPPENGLGPKVLMSFVYSFTGTAAGASAYPVNSADMDGAATVFDDHFAVLAPEWIPRDLSGGTGASGTIAVADNKLVLALTNTGWYGACNSNVLTGTFDVQAEIEPPSGTACGLLLFKDGSGFPDTSSYLRLERTVNSNGDRVVRSYAVDNGHTAQISWWGIEHPFYEYTLTNDPMGYEALAFRMQRDDRADCLRLKYAYERTVDGETLCGWMEFPTVEDWDVRGFHVCPYVRSESADAEARFTRVAAARTRRDDPAVDATGFGVSERIYTFSGISGTGLVVTFDQAFPHDEDVRFVFWDQAGRVPWWHIDDKCAFSYEFCETWGGGTEWKGQAADTCCEPMADRLLRWSYAEVVESNDVRIVIHWSYMLANEAYQWWGRDPDPDNRPLGDEWYIFYPDGTGIRKVTYTPATGTVYGTKWNEISEPMMVQRGGVLPGECLSFTALSSLSLDGDDEDYRYFEDPPQTIVTNARCWNEAVFRVNLHNRPCPFEVFAQGDAMFPQTFPARYSEPEWDGWGSVYENEWHSSLERQRPYTNDFWPFAHWPISRIPYEEDSKTMSRYLREPGHTSIMGVPGHWGASNAVTWAMMIGLSDPEDDADILAKTRSWLYPGVVSMLSADSRFLTNDYTQRALVFTNDAHNRTCSFSVDPSTASSVLINPVFRINGWGEYPVRIRCNGSLLHEPADYRAAIVDGDALIWMESTFRTLNTFTITD